MFSLYVSIVKDSSYLDIDYYLVTTQFSNEQDSETQLVSSTCIEDLLESFMKQVDYWDDFNHVVIETKHPELHNILMLLTKQKKTNSYTKLLNLHFPTESAKVKYKNCFNKQMVNVLPLVDD